MKALARYQVILLGEQRHIRCQCQPSLDHIIVIVNLLKENHPHG